MRKTIAIIGLITSTAAITKVCCQTSRLTSDASKTPHGLPIPPGGIYVAPADNVFIEFRTNTTFTVIVRQEVTSNVIRRTFWMSNGQRFTNDSLLTNTVISVTTNSL